MSNLDDLERIDQVVDDIVDLQAQLKNDIEARDTKLEKYEKILEEMVAKINSFEEKINDLVNTNNNLEEKLETKIAKITSLEAKLKATETRITDLEGKLVDYDSENVTEVVIQAENDLEKNGNHKRPHQPDDNGQIEKKRRKDEV